MATLSGRSSKMTCEVIFDNLGFDSGVGLLGDPFTELPAKRHHDEQVHGVLLIVLAAWLAMSKI